MSTQPILRELRDVLAEKLCVSADDMNEETSFVGDLGADSLDMIELVMELEDRYHIAITEREASDFVTIGDAARFIQLRLTDAQT